jgi:hypothetical protein
MVAVSTFANNGAVQKRRAIRSLRPTPALERPDDVQRAVNSFPLT